MNRLSNFILFSELILHLQDNNVVLWLNLRENYKMGRVVQCDKVGSLEFGGNILVLPFCLYIVTAKQNPYSTKFVWFVHYRSGHLMRHYLGNIMT